MYHTILENIFIQFQEQTRHTRAVILAPESKHADALIARLLYHPEYTSLYYALSVNDTDLSTFLDNLIRAFSESHPRFGRYTSVAQLTWHNGITAFREAVILGILRDLSELTSHRVLLILDDFDHAEQAEDIQHFLEELASRLPDHCLMIFNGRRQPRLPWISLIAHTRAIIFNDGQLMIQPVHVPPNKVAELEIYAIGPGLVYLNGQLVSQWEGHLPRLLLFFAIDRGVITREDFQRAFWENLDDVQATNVFHVTKRRLHRALGMEVLEHKNGCYQLRDGLSIYYDAFDWTQTLVSARDITNPDPTHAYERLLGLYRGAFLKSHDDKWVATRRQDILAGYIEAVLYLAQHHAQRFLSDPTTQSAALDYAYQLYLKALNEAPNHPDLLYAAAQLLTQPEVNRRIEAHHLLHKYLQTKKKTKEPADPRLMALSKQIHTS